MEVGENGEEECGWCMEKRPNSRGPITPCDSIYKKCHSATQNYKNVTHGPLMLAHSLRWRGNDMAMMWQVSSTKY